MVPKDIRCPYKEYYFRYDQCWECSQTESSNFFSGLDGSLYIKEFFSRWGEFDWTWFYRDTGQSQWLYYQPGRPLKIFTIIYTTSVIFTLHKWPSKIPRIYNIHLQNSWSFASASKIREAPIRLPNAADRVVANIPIRTKYGQ
jgi:hypothetical protein